MVNYADSASLTMGILIYKYEVESWCGGAIRYFTVMVKAVCRRLLRRNGMDSFKVVYWRAAKGAERNVRGHVGCASEVR